ncbi:DNA polymerase Y family protein [soil metagenome]
MTYWLALYCPSHCAPSPNERPDEPPGSSPDAQALGHWALQFTPRVAFLEDAVVLEVEASLKLFGGPVALRRKVARDARQLGCQRMAWAPTSLAALALARALQPDGFSEPLQALLDRLPIDGITAVAAHTTTLSRLGCQTLGDVRALPRAGLSRRFGKGLLDAMDRAYGLLPESHVWLELPETFEARLELPGRVENAAALMFAAQRLLIQMGAWLTARHSGVTSFVLSWQHDFHRREAGPGGELRVRTAHATRHIDHLRRLLSEQLDRVPLAAPVGALALRADEVELLPETSGGLWPQREMQGGADAVGMSQMKESELIERLGARLGADCVVRPVLHADHRVEAMQSWEPAAISRTATARRKPAITPEIQTGPQPAWILPEPLPLSTRNEHPIHRGPLQMVAGPNRVEVGWWADGTPRPSGTPADPPRGFRPAWERPGAGPVGVEQGPRPASTLRVQRDYYVAKSARAGLLWIYCERPAHGSLDGPAPWFLHGIFA